MKKTIITIISLAIFTVGSTYAQDLQEILDKYFETAGQKKLLTLKTLVFSGKTLQMGMEMPFFMADTARAASASGTATRTNSQP